MIQINLLPWREEARKFKKRRFIAGTVASAILGVILVVCAHIYLLTVSHDQYYLNDYLTNEVKNEQAAVNSNKTQQQEKLNVEKALRQIIDLQNQSYDAIRLVNELSVAVPESISLTRIERTGSTINLDGFSTSDAEVTTFLGDLKKSKLFAKVTLSQITSGSDSADTKRNFEITAIQKEATGG